MARRINLKGISGSGKTTLGRELAARLGLPYVELDALHHGPDWSEPTDEEFRARVREAMGEGGWVVDGNYERKLGGLVLGAADTVVWLDLPLPLILQRLWRRTSHRIRDDVELWSGNRETWRNAVWGRESLFLWALRRWVRDRRDVPKLAAEHPRLRLMRLRSPEAVREWLEAQRPES